MIDIEKFKNEIIESIDKVRKQQEQTNELLLKFDEKKENDDEDLEEAEEESEPVEEEEIEVEEANELEAEVEEEIQVEENDLQTLIEQNELLLQELQEMNQNQIESSWLISLTIVITLGFSYFIKQLSKW